MPDPKSALRFFGKMPAHGDFVARGFDRATQMELDEWLSGSLEMARLDDPISFEDRYNTAPPWFLRFPESRRAEEGVLVPSVDSVGRRFPLILKHPLVEGMEPGRLAAALADLAREAIISGWDANTLSAQVIDLDAGEWYTDPPVDTACWWSPETERNDAMHCIGHRPPV